MFSNKIKKDKPRNTLVPVKHRKPVLEQTNSLREFNDRFKEMFDISFIEWKRKAKKNCEDGMIEWTDGKIWVGQTSFHKQLRVYIKTTK